MREARVDQGLLCCPVCYATEGLHLHKVEDRGRGTCAMGDECTGVTIYGECEICGSRYSLDIYGHKGAVILEGREERGSA